MRTVKVFVSGLFSSMMYERDILHRQVSALINQRLGWDEQVSVIFVDLRWGIDTRDKLTSSARTEYVIEKCFEAIDDSDLFLGILASEYGTLVSPELVKQYIDDAGLTRESYTSMEIRYASARFPRERMMFMLTEPTEEDLPEIAELKRDLASRCNVRYYRKNEINNDSGSTLFMDGITEMICNALKTSDFGHRSSAEN